MSQTMKACTYMYVLTGFPINFQGVRDEVAGMYFEAINREIEVLEKQTSNNSLDESEKNAAISGVLAKFSIHFQRLSPKNFSFIFDDKIKFINKTHEYFNAIQSLPANPQSPLSNLSSLCPSPTIGHKIEDISDWFCKRDDELQKENEKLKLVLKELQQEKLPRLQEKIEELKQENEKLKQEKKKPQKRNLSTQGHFASSSF